MSSISAPELELAATELFAEDEASSDCLITVLEDSSEASSYLNLENLVREMLMFSEACSMLEQPPAEN